MKRALFETKRQPAATKYHYEKYPFSLLSLKKKKTNFYSTQVTLSLIQQITRKMQISGGRVNLMVRPPTQTYAPHTSMKEIVKLTNYKLFRCTGTYSIKSHLFNMKIIQS